MVLAPEHPLVSVLTTQDQKANVDEYIRESTRQTEIQRESTEKEKTGVFTGGYAINPVNNEKVPVWVADYVLMTYGTGAVMGVPAHDQRDFDFARKFGINVRVVIQPEDMEELDGNKMPSAVPAEGRMVNSGDLTGTPAGITIKSAIEYITNMGVGKRSVTFRIRDWLISRQRYWGAPIPIVFCEKCGEIPVPDEQLPVELPEDVVWKPTGESPLKLHPTWRFTTCPKCGGKAERETDTMDTFMCSSWYHLRYLSPNFENGPFDPKEYDYWMPVDTYTGGVEHATMHLMYTRFFHKAFRDIGVLKGSEPMLQLRNQGQILGPDGQRMSKSRGNVVDPDEQVRLYGADTVRAYLMFGYRWQDGGPWDPGNIQGSYRWLGRVWSAFLDKGNQSGVSAETASEMRRKLHKTLKAVTNDFHQFEFNTVVSGLMTLLNELMAYKEKGGWNSSTWNEATEIYIKMLAPIAPHISEEIWARLGKPFSIHQQSWPEVDESATKDEKVELVIQINGKVRQKMLVDAEISEAEIRQLALKNENIEKLLGNQSPKKIIYVKGRLLNIVI
jgi:leucyl-tRNA synthetase